MYTSYRLIFIIYIFKTFKLKKFIVNVSKHYVPALFHVTDMLESTGKAKVRQTLCFSPFHPTVPGTEQSPSMQVKR